MSNHSGNIKVSVIGTTSGTTTNSLGLLSLMLGSWDYAFLQSAGGDVGSKNPFEGD